MTDNMQGIYDTIYSTFDLGPGFWNRELRTMDLEGFMSYHWIDPRGNLWTVDHTGTYDFEDFGEKFKIVKNINHGRVSPFPITKQLELYPAHWTAHYAPTPSAMVTFVEGHVEQVLFSSHT
jgi:hypothetical protein|tara:strand:- start:1165 stop:1527 length:363 start_codon:yes stop_codon:yes gene_type:complete